MGVIEQTVAALAGTGEGALDVAEELALDQLGGDRRAVDRHERALRARAGLVQRARHDLLAGARLALQQHRARHLPDPAHHRAQLLDRGRVPDQADRIRRQPGQLAPQHEVLARQPRALEAALDRVEDLVDAEGLEDEVRCAAAQRVDRSLHVGEGGDQDHVAGVAVLAQLVQPFDAGLARQRDVEDQQVEMQARHQRRGVLGIARGLHHAAAAGERALEEVAHALLVVHHQHRMRLPVVLGQVHRQRSGRRLRVIGGNRSRPHTSGRARPFCKLIQHRLASRSCFPHRPRLRAPGLRRA